MISSDPLSPFLNVAYNRRQFSLLNQNYAGPIS